jgi:hypothetical protein
MDMISTSFFVTKFPEEVGWGDLWRLFARFGSVSDVFIPKKMDKWGRRFGFVKFKEVKNVEMLCKELEDVWWNNVKLRVNRARFSKGDKKEEASSGQKQNPRPLAGSDPFVNDEVSFKSLLVREGGAKIDKDGMVVSAEGERKKTRVVNLGDTIPLDIQVQAGSLKLLNQSMVGFFKETMDFQSFQDRLLMEGQHEVRATVMGGNMVLLQSSCEGELKEVMKFNKAWWDQCFLKIIPWQPNLLSECRNTWIQIYGIPLHGWEENSFKRIAGRFGVFLDFDEATIAKHRLDVARVKLRTVRRGIIDTVLRLKIRGEFFDVWVVEERCSCGEENNYTVDEGHRSSNSNSGEQGWKGDDEDVFSDGRSDSDGSESDKALLGLQEVDKRNQTVIVAGDKGGVENIDSQSQNYIPRNVGEIMSDAPVEEEHVAEEGESNPQIPICEVAVDVREIRGEEVGAAVTFTNLKRQACEVLVSGSDSIQEDQCVGPGGPEVEVQNSEAVDSHPICSKNNGGVQEVQDLAEGVADVEGGGIVRLSQLSESSSEPSQSLGGQNCHRNSKKGSNHGGRPIPPMLGIPKFRQLELTLKAAGRKRKEGNKELNEVNVLSSGSVQAESVMAPISEGEASPGIDLHVELPFIDSGLNCVVDSGGGFVPDSNLEEEVNVITKEEEARILIGLQKEVGFNFEVGDDEVQRKLVELEDSDRGRNVELVQANVDQ